MTWKDNEKPVLVIAGPTASGKTGTAMLLARSLNGEIVSADSMQIYRGMDIGTAKATPREQTDVPHHLLDILDPGQPYSVADYKQDATNAIHDIYSRQRWPILCGGTGQYLSAMIEGLVFSKHKPDLKLRDRLNEQADQSGNRSLLDQLELMDPETAGKLALNDRKRIIRALEINLQTGKTMAQQNIDSRKSGPDFCYRTFILDHDRPVLYERINRRVDEMIGRGLVDEVKRLMERGVPENSTCLQAIGYKELIPFIKGETRLDQAIENIAMSTRRYAKRQLTWFRKMNDTTWLTNLSSGENMSNILEKTKFSI